MENQDFMYRMIYNMKMMLWEQSPIYNEYMEARKLHQEIINSMSKEMHQKNLSPNEMLESIHAPDFELDFRIDLHNNIYGDMLVYTHLDGFTSLTDQYLNKHRFRKEEKIEMLEAMKASRLSVYDFVSRDDENAVTMIKNVLTKEEIPLSDRQLGDIPETVKDSQLVMRVIHYKDIYFQTGVFFSLKRNHTTRKWINAHKNALLGDQQLLLLVDVFNFYKINGDKQVEAKYL